MRFRYLIHSLEDDEIWGTNFEYLAKNMIEEILENGPNSTLEIIDVKKGLRYFDGVYEIPENDIF